MSISTTRPCSLRDFGGTGSASEARVSGPTRPSIPMRLAFWKAYTACSVRAPKLPSSGPIQYRRDSSRSCNSSTDGPSSPAPSTGGGVVVGGVVGGGVVVGGVVGGGVVVGGVVVGGVVVGVVVVGGVVVGGVVGGGVVVGGVVGGGVVGGGVVVGGVVVVELTGRSTGAPVMAGSPQAANRLTTATPTHRLRHRLANCSTDLPVPMGHATVPGPRAGPLGFRGSRQRSPVDAGADTADHPAGPESRTVVGRPEPRGRAVADGYHCFPAGESCPRGRFGHAVSASGPAGRTGRTECHGIARWPKQDRQVGTARCLRGRQSKTTGHASGQAISSADGADEAAPGRQSRIR